MHVGLLVGGHAPVFIAGHMCGRPWLPIWLLFASRSQPKFGQTHGPQLIGLLSLGVRLSGLQWLNPCSGEIQCARLSARELGQTGLRGHLAGVDR
jgi:hypothetical protein